MSAYRPIVIAKPAELGALEMVGDTLGPAFNPVLVIPPRVWNWDDDTYAKTLEEHYAVLLGALGKSATAVSFL